MTENLAFAVFSFASYADATLPRWAKRILSTNFRLPRGESDNRILILKMKEHPPL